MDRVRNIRVARVSAWTTAILDVSFVVINVIAAFTYGWGKVWPNLLVTGVMLALATTTLYALGAFNSHKYNAEHSPS